MSKNKEEILNKILKNPVERFFSIERAAVSANDSRTVDLSFSSDAVILQYSWDIGYYYLILDHSEGCFNFDRLNNAGALLWMHDAREQIGVCDRAWVEGNKGCATVRFSTSECGEENYQDVLAGIKRNVSFRASLRSAEAELGQDGKIQKINDIPVYRSKDWEVLEISLVSIPADYAIGVGRSENSDQTINQQVLNLPTAPIAVQNNVTENKEMPPVNTENTENKPTAEVNAISRIETFRTIGEVYKQQTLAQRYELEGKSEDELKKEILRLMTEDQPNVPVQNPAETAKRNGVFQPAQTIRRTKLKSFTGKDAELTAVRSGHFLNAALFRNEESVAFCKQNGISIKRAHSEGDNEFGGFLVPPEFENVIIDLRLQYGVARQWANVVPMSSDSKSRPRRKGGLKAYPVGAKGTSRRLTESKKKWDLVSLLSKKWGVLAKYEEELNEDAIINLADDFASEISYAFTEVEDDCFFNGDGTSDYHEITGIIPALTSLSGTVAHIAGLQVASGNLWSEIVLADILGMVGKLPSFARNSGQVAWFCSNEFWATVLVRIAAGLGGTALAQLQDEIAPRFLGKPVVLAEKMPHVEADSQVPLLYGNPSQGVMMGDRRGIAVKMTDSNDTDFEEDLMAIKGTERFDINVHDVGNADSTAKNRQPGPIVGLITAAS